MEPVRPALRPDPALDREDMVAMQHEIADRARFEDDLSFDPRALASVDGDRAPHAKVSSPGDGDGAPHSPGSSAGDGPDDPTQDPVVVGVDQAFTDDRAVSAVVASVGDAVVERSAAVVDLEHPYVPGLLAFREGGPVVAAFRDLAVDPDLLLVDGSGRLHYREAGLATHLGVLFDVPAVGVAKRLLCGTPAASLEEKRPAGSRVAIRADGDVETAPDGAKIGVALQTRQYESADRWVNPVYVSPGHRVGVETAANLVERCCSAYKLPDPIRRADRYASEVRADLA